MSMMKGVPPVHFAVLAFVAGLGAAAGCGHEETPAPAAPTPVVAVTPTPAPAPTPTPSAASCPLPESSNPENNCAASGARLSGQVNQAIDALLRNHPELFNFEDMNGGNPKVLVPTRYYLELKNELLALGVCVKIEEEEIAIKSTNAFSEDWGVLTTAGYVRRRYRGTCTPAWW